MRMYFCLTIAVLLGGCTTQSPNSEAAAVMLSSQPAPQACRFIGEVSGSQGNILTTDSNRNQGLIQGARNELRNNALKMGANYVVLANQTQTVNAQGEGGVYNASLFGNAYACPLEQAQSNKLAG